MNRLPMSRAAAGLLRALLARVEEDRDRIFLTDLQSTDWQSLTFVGERHQFRFSLRGPGAADLLERFTGGLEDADFRISGQVVADIALEGRPVHADDGSISFTIEALTIAE